MTEHEKAIIFETTKQNLKRAVGEVADSIFVVYKHASAFAARGGSEEELKEILRPLIEPASKLVDLANLLTSAEDRQVLVALRDLQSLTSSASS